MKRHFKNSFYCFIYWAVISYLFCEDKIEIDGNKSYGIPYRILSQYYSRNRDYIYEYHFYLSNFILDVVFVLITSLFYYFIFKANKSKLVNLG